MEIRVQSKNANSEVVSTNNDPQAQRRPFQRPVLTVVGSVVLDTAARAMIVPRYDGVSYAS